MYGTLTYSWLKLMVNLAKYPVVHTWSICAVQTFTTHGSKHLVDYHSLCPADDSLTNGLVGWMSEPLVWPQRLFTIADENTRPVVSHWDSDTNKNQTAVSLNQNIYEYMSRKKRSQQWQEVCFNWLIRLMMVDGCLAGSTSSLSPYQAAKNKPATPSKTTVPI